MRPTKRGFSSSKLDVNAMMLGYYIHLLSPIIFAITMATPRMWPTSFDLQPPYVKMEEC